MMESLKGYIFVATTAVGITLYVHQTFATNISLAKANKRILEVELKQSRQHKVSCLIALKLKVDQKELIDICNLNLK